MSVNNNIPQGVPEKKPQKYTRADALHDQMVRLGEIQEVKEPINKKRFAITALIILLIIVALPTGVSAFWKTFSFACPTAK